MLFGTSGVKFFRTPSNITGRNGLPDSNVSASCFFNLVMLGISNWVMNSANAVNVGYPT